MIRLSIALLKRAIVLSLIIISSNEVLSQEADDIIRLETRLRTYYKIKENAELEEFKDLKKLTWLLFIPGVGYDFINQNPYIVYNTSSLFSYFNQKKKQEHKREAIKKQNEIDFQSDQVKLHRLYLRLISLFDEYELEYSVYEDYKKLYVIKKGKYENDEIILETILLMQIQLKQRKQALHNIEEKIHDVALQIELLIHDNINYSLNQIKKGSADTLPNILNDTINPIK